MNKVLKKVMEERGYVFPAGFDELKETFLKPQLDKMMESSMKYADLINFLEKKVPKLKLVEEDKVILRQFLDMEARSLKALSKTTEKFRKSLK